MTHVLQVLFLSVFILQVVMHGLYCIIYTYGLAMMWISRMFNPSKVISPRALQLSMFTPYESNNCILLYYAIRSVIV